MRIEIKKKRIYGNGVRRLWGHDCQVQTPTSMYNYRVIVDGKLVDSFRKLRNARRKVRQLENPVQLPMDTILDTDPPAEFSPGVIELLKQLYLTPNYASQKLAEGASPTTIIDAFETLRRQGLMQVTDDGTHLVLRPTEAGITASEIIKILKTSNQGAKSS